MILKHLKASFSIISKTQRLGKTGKRKIPIIQMKKKRDLIKSAI
ncbi:hypothetical protein [Leptotrichia massiliensis]